MFDCHWKKYGQLTMTRNLDFDPAQD